MLFVRGDEKFFGPLRSQMDLLREASRLLLEGVQSGDDGLTQCARRIDEFREKIAHFDRGLMVVLHRSLITPFDPEDILALSSAIKKLIDSLAEAASRQQFCACPPPAELVKALEIADQCSSRLSSAFAS